VDTKSFPAAGGVVQRELDALVVVSFSLFPLRYGPERRSASTFFLLACWAPPDSLDRCFPNGSRPKTQVQHDHCIQMRAYCWKESYVYIVVNLARGEVLVDWITQKKRCTELEAAIITNAILKGVAYLHSNKIVHRDLKLDNLMFDVPGDLRTLKILDYGFSKVLQSAGDVLTTVCGSPQYVAPEIIMMTQAPQGSLPQVIPYTYAVDAWSIGVIMYMLIAGYAPFDEEDEMLMFNKIVRGEFTFPSDPWDNISNEAKELICGLLTVNPYRRVNPQQALESSWISMHSRALQGGLGT